MTHCPHCHCKLGEPHVPLSALVSDEVVEALWKALGEVGWMVTDDGVLPWDDPDAETDETKADLRRALQAAHKALQEAEHD